MVQEDWALDVESGQGFEEILGKAQWLAVLGGPLNCDDVAFMRFRTNSRTRARKGMLIASP